MVDIYDYYKWWCLDKGVPVLTKAQFKNKLDEYNLYSETGTVNKKTYRNIVVGHEVKI